MGPSMTHLFDSYLVLMKFSIFLAIVNLHTVYPFQKQCSCSDTF